MLFMIKRVSIQKCIQVTQTISHFTQSFIEKGIFPANIVSKTIKLIYIGKSNVSK